MYGRAKCKQCGKIVRAKVEKDIECPRCGRIFRIPNDSRYIIKTETASPYSSIPSITSTGKTRSSRVSTLDRFTQDPTRREGDWHPQPIRQKRRKRTADIPAMIIFPEDRLQQVIEDKNFIWIIIEFPQHQSLEEIVWRISEQLLILESTKPLCAYQNEIALPVWAKEPSRINFNNGFLEMMFEK